MIGKVNMKKLNSKETKQVLLQILVFFDEFCKKNNLRYTLAYGTLLGAARHEGFIPWDDDIDVEMPLSDYRKCLSILEKQPISSRYQLHSMNTELKYNEKYYYPFAKLEDSQTQIHIFKTHDIGGAFIDIFPMTPLPRNEKLWYFYNKKARLLKIMISGIDGTNRSKFRNSVSYLEGKIFNYRSIRNSLWNLATKYETHNSSSYLVDGTWHDYKDKNFFPKEWFDSYNTLLFEGYNLSVIENYKEMLKHDYGNWKKLPPRSQRVPHHDYDLFLKRRKDENS